MGIKIKSIGVLVLTGAFVVSLLGFKVVGAVIIPPPTLASISPVQTAVPASFTLNGANFQGATINIYNSAGTLVATSPYTSIASDGTSLTFSLSSAFMGMVGAGTYSVKVVTGSGTSNGETFTVVASTSTALTVSSVTPTSATPGATINVAGTNFDNTTYVSVDNGAWTLTPSVYALGTTLSFVLPSNITAGSHTVQIGNKGSAYAAVNAGTITISVPTVNTPTLTSVSPSQAAAGAVVTLYGTNLTGATTVNFYQGGKWTGSVAEQNITVANNGTSLSFIVDAPFAANWPGSSQVDVVTSGGTSNMLPITIIAPSTNIPTQGSAAPTVQSMTPTNAAPGATINVSGSGYDSTTYVSVDNGGWTLTPSVYALGTTLSFVLPSNITAGSHTVQIGNKGSAYAAVNAGTVVVAVPATSSAPATTSTNSTANASSTVAGDSSYQALQQQLVQLMTLLIQLLEQASAKGLLTASQLNAALGTISH